MKKSELRKLIREEIKGWSPQVGQTKGLTPKTLNKILMKIASDDEYTPDAEVEEAKNPVDQIIPQLDKISSDLEGIDKRRYQKAISHISDAIFVLLSGGEDLNESNCKHGRYFCPHDKVYKCRKGPKKSR